MKLLCLKATGIVLALALAVFTAAPLAAADITRTAAVDNPLPEKVIADTLAAHQILCLSTDGLIKKVLLDGNWVAVQEVELTGHTLIIRTDYGSLSLAAP